MNKTKLISNALLVSIGLMNPSAHADFNCTSYDGDKTLELHEPKPSVTRAYNLVLKMGAEAMAFEALPTHIEESDLYDKFEYKLWNANTPSAVLTIATRLVVGRGGPGIKTISGKLTYEGTETTFRCHEADQ